MRSPSLSPAGREHRGPSGRRGRVVLGLVALAATSLLVTTTVSAVPPTTDPSTAADYGAGWLAEAIGDDGSVGGGFDPLGDAGSAALALAAAGVEAEAFDRALGFVLDNAESFVAPFGTDDPGRLGRAMMLADVAGVDPGDFGGVDLPARLLASLGAYETGLYGAGDPTYDGAFRQGLAIVGLVAIDEPVPAAALTWLTDQQCDAATPEAEGGWESYRADLATPCTAPDGTLFVGPDSNSSAMAVMGLAAASSVPSDALAFLASVEEPDGGWAFQYGGGSDPNSTGMVIQALIAAGEDPDEWGSPGARPDDSLLSWQVACGAADEGAFSSPFSGGAGDVFASLDAIPAAAGRAWPLDGPLSLASGSPAPCVPDVDDTTTTTADGSTDDDDPPPAAPADPVAAAADFTG